MTVEVIIAILGGLTLLFFLWRWWSWLQPSAPRMPGPDAHSLTNQMRLPRELSETKKLEDDARRFARLLVSEIKLYHAYKVETGKRNNNLYSQLQPEIDKAREMFLKRAHPISNAEAIFREMLINELASGDESKLGASPH